MVRRLSGEDCSGTSSDPEASPPIPSASLAAGAAAGVDADIARASAKTGRRGLSSGTKEIWALSWPVMLSQAMVTAVGLIDIAMVGRLGALSVAAVGYATQFFFMAQSMLIAVGFACVALMARAIGSGDPERARRAMMASIVVAVGTSLLAIAVVLSVPRTLMAWLNAEPAVIELTLPYLRLVFASSLLLSVSMTLEYALRADRKTATPMRIAAVVTVVKVALNAVLIFGLLGAPAMGIEGAGWATLGSQLLAVVLFSWVVVRAPAHSPLSASWADLRSCGPLLKEVVRLAAPGVAERVVLNTALLAYFAILGAYGTVAVAAYTVGVRVLAFSWIPGTGFAAAVATLVGQALGRKDRRGAETVAWSGARTALITAVVLGTACALAREDLARLFTNDEATIAVLVPFMLMLAVAQPMLQLHFTLGGAHRGAGDTWTPLLAATLGNWGLRVPMAVVAAKIFHSDLMWVWAALVFDHSARALWMAWSFKRGIWLRRSGIRSV